MSPKEFIRKCEIQGLIKQYKYFKYSESFDPCPDGLIIKKLCNDGFIDYCAIHGDAKIRSIAETMQISYGYKCISSKTYKRITDKQKYALAVFLMNKFATAKDVICAVYDMSSDEFESIFNELT